MKQGLRQGRVLAPLLFNIFFAVVVNVAYTHYLKAIRYIMDALVHIDLRQKRGRGAGGATAGGLTLPVLSRDRSSS